MAVELKHETWFRSLSIWYRSNVHRLSRLSEAQQERYESRSVSYREHSGLLDTLRALLVLSCPQEGLKTSQILGSFQLSPLSTSGNCSGLTILKHRIFIHLVLLRIEYTELIVWDNLNVVETEKQNKTMMIMTTWSCSNVDMALGKSTFLIRFKDACSRNTFFFFNAFKSVLGIAGRACTGAPLTLLKALVNTACFTEVSLM